MVPFQITVHEYIMSISKIAVRYAKALFLSAKEHEVMDKVRYDMELLLEVTTGDNQIREMLLSPIVKSKSKFQVLTSIFSDRISSLSLDFLNLVTRNKREECIPGMCRHLPPVT